VRPLSQHFEPVNHRPATCIVFVEVGIEVNIWTTPVEDRTPFEQDHHHTAYDPEYAQRCWRILLQADRVLTDFRSRFSGKRTRIK
jgi:hypothetical protein